MISFLKNHPFAVETHFESSTVLTFAVPKEDLQQFIPACLTLDTFKGQWAFIAVAMVRAKRLRPKGLPRFVGNDFFLIGYRIFVRYTNDKGKRLRGLYILKSETNTKKMEILGNVFTHYNYSTTDIHEEVKKGGSRVIQSVQSDFSLKIDTSKKNVALPMHSPFGNWKEARHFAGPLPFTFTCFEEKKEILIIEGVRKNWKPKPIAIADWKFSFFDELKIKSHILANAFVIEDVPYYWKKGKIEQWVE